MPNDKISQIKIQFKFRKMNFQFDFVKDRLFSVKSLYIKLTNTQLINDSILSPGNYTK